MVAALIFFGLFSNQDEGTRIRVSHASFLFSLGDVQSSTLSFLACGGQTQFSSFTGNDRKEGTLLS
jgi:hypothetical protein